MLCEALDLCSQHVRWHGADYAVPKQGLEALTKALETIQTEITARKGRMVVKQEPHAVSEKEEANLAEELKNLELASQEVDGDEDSEDSD